MIKTQKVSLKPSETSLCCALCNVTWFLLITFSTIKKNLRERNHGMG